MGKLFQDARCGTPAAIHQLLASHESALLATAARMREASQHGDVDIEQLVSTTLHTAHTQFADFDGTTDQHLREWLERILLRQFHQLSSDAAERLSVALATLPTVQGQVVRLRQINSWTLSRIASHLSLSEVAVAGLLRQGLHRLRTTIESREVDES